MCKAPKRQCVDRRVRNGLVEDVAERADDRLAEGIHDDGTQEFSFHRRHDGRVEPAWADFREVREVRVHVVREAVVRDVSANRDADRAELTALDPYAALSGVAVRGDAEFLRGTDEDLLEVAHVLPRIKAIGELHDRIADELAGSMVCRLAASFDLDHRDGGIEDVVNRPSTAQRDHVGMLKEEKRVRNLVGGPPLHEIALQVPGLAVLHEPQVDRERFVHFRFTTWIARPSAASAASMIASGSVGCGWIVRAMSCTLAPISIASAISLMRSLASGPTIWTPSRRVVFASMTTFTKPSVSPAANARPIAANGTFPTRTSKPFCVAAASSSPTVATSGSVKIADGNALQSAAAARPAATSAATMPSFEALCAKNGWPTTSPTAKISRTFLPISLSTRMNPFSSVPTPAFARFSPSVLGRRPIVTRTASTTNSRGPSGVSAATTIRPSTSLQAVAWDSTWTSAPSFFRDRATIRAASGSTPGRIWARNSTTVSCVPSLAK